MQLSQKVKLMNVFMLSSIILALMTLQGCSGGGSSSSSSSVSIITGSVVDSPVEGLSYRCSTSNLTGTTNTNGEYTCQSGENVVFSLGDLLIGTVATSDTPLTPYTFFSTNTAAAINLAQLLQTMDDNNDTSDGIKCDATKIALVENLSLEFNSTNFDSDVNTVITLVSEQDALTALNTYLNENNLDVSDGVNIPVGIISTTVDGSTITYSAANSYDEDNDSISYTWSISSQPGSSVAVLSNTTNEDTNLTIDADGTYTINLNVDDGTYYADTNFTMTFASGSLVTLSEEALGESLFKDTSLSLTRTMSCATCHTQNQSFIDTRDNGVDGAVSLGDDGTSLGDRNTPKVNYASFTPAFSQSGNGDFFGGQFWDGRASSLEDQAQGPFLNSIEMQMPDVASVIDRVMENAIHVASFKALYGSTIFDDNDDAFTSLADAIALFERTDDFASFDSDFDEDSLSAAATRGEVLFRQVDCDRCHRITTNNDNVTGNTEILFTNFEYENLGIPINTTVRNKNGHATDLGLSENPNVSDSGQDGKFKTQSLRNVAVTGPYMHNGVFENLKTVVHFYNTRDVNGAINPETNAGWRTPEVSTNVTRRDVGNLGLTDAEEDDIVSFLEALTDSQYKSLIP